MSFVKKLIKLTSLKNNFLFYSLIFLCLLIAFHYRLRSYWLYPPIQDTFDEFAMVWQGQSIAKTGIPTSWSYHPYYVKGIPQDSKLDLNGLTISVNGTAPNKTNYGKFPKPVLLTQEVNMDGYKSHFNFVSPYLEQPPLGGLVIAFPSILKGKDTFSKDIKEARSPFVIYGVISCILVIIFTNLIYGRQTAVLSGLLYATIPTIVIGSRLALPENIITIFILAELIFLELYRRKKKAIYFWISIVLSFISPLIKLFGLVNALIGVIFFVVVIKDFRKSLVFASAGLLSLFTYFVYGLSIDKNTFFWALSYQSQRFFAGPIVLLTKILIPKITKIFLDGWVVFGWIALIIIMFKEKFSKHALILIGISSYLLILILFGGEDYGWYRMPLYPFLIICAGWLTLDVIKRAEIFPSIIYLLIGIASSFSWGLGISNWTPYLMLFRFFILVFIGIFSIRLLIKKDWTLVLSSAMLLIIFIVSIFLNTRTINNLNRIWPQLGDKSSLIIGRP